MPSVPAQPASEVVSRMRPAFATAYSGDAYAPVPSAALEETFTAAPTGERASGARSRWRSAIGERRFSVSAASHSASGASG
jgi:hypothetical protein